MQVVFGGNDVYLFDDGEGKAELQYVVCAGANQDVAMYQRVKEEEWQNALAAVRADMDEDLTIHDHREYERPKS